MPGLSLNSNVDSEMKQKHLINTLYDDDIASVFKADAAGAANIQHYIKYFRYPIFRFQIFRNTTGGALAVPRLWSRLKLGLWRSSDF